MTPKLPILFLLFVAACNSPQVDSPTQVQVKVDGHGDAKHTTDLYIKDTSGYSPQFLADFREHHGSGYKTVSLVDDSIVINNDYKEVITIPTDLPLNVPVTYVDTTGDTTYVLQVKRKNYSTLEYNFRQSTKNVKIDQQHGQASIEALFYLGAEGTFEYSDSTFGMNEYIDKEQADCEVYVYIGMQNIERSFVAFHCKAGKEKPNTPELKRIK